MNQDDVLATVYQTLNPAEEAITFATAEDFGAIFVSIVQGLFHLQDVYTMFLCSYLIVDRSYHL